MRLLLGILLYSVSILFCFYFVSTIVTCGADGDVRVYKGFEDDDPVTHRVGDCAYSVLCKVTLNL